jgi:tRNA (guanine37-N1)-methyltransferase
MLKIDIVTIFPNIFKSVLDESILKRAQQNKKVKIEIFNLRDYTDDPHKKVDDKPFGGGSGMVIKCEPVFGIIDEIKKEDPKTKTILLTPQGTRFNQRMAKSLSKEKHFVLICGHYEGIDERIRENLICKEISIGDYVLTGGEIPALVIIDAVVRLIPGVLGDKDSAEHDTFTDNLLEYPQYTRPADFRGMKVPKILLSGNHKLIDRWRKEQAYLKTKKKRPDLLNDNK